MSDLTKMKLVYSGELVIIAVVFLVLAILQVTGVRPMKPSHLVVFNWITIFGGTWVVVDFFWTLLSPRRRKKNCLLDKCLNLPLGIYLLFFNIYCFINRANLDSDAFNALFLAMYGTSFVFFYVFVSYTFQGVYHWFKPLKTLVDELKKEEKAKLEANQEPKENKDSSPEDK